MGCNKSVYNISYVNCTNIDATKFSTYDVKFRKRIVETFKMEKSKSNLDINLNDEIYITMTCNLRANPKCLVSCLDEYGYTIRVEIKDLGDKTIDYRIFAKSSLPIIQSILLTLP